MQRKAKFEVELQGNTKVYRTEFGKSIKTNKAFTQSMQGMARGTSAIDGPLGGVASRITAVSGIMSSGALAVTAFGAALAALSFTAYGSLKVFDEYQRNQLKTEALIKATGNAAGFSSNQLRAEADAVALNTLASVGGIQEAQIVLQSFKSVSGETFNEAIRLSQDMAAAFSGQAKDKALQLGKALEDPINGINALKRSGVSFTQSERDMVRSMVAACNAAEAQVFILKKLRDQIGGAGSAEAGGLAGAVDTMDHRWEQLLLSFEKTTGGGKIAQAAIAGITGALVGLKEAIDPSIGALEKKLASLEESTNSSRARRQRRGGDQSGRINALKQQILEAKAAEGDVVALNQLLDQTNEKISGLENAIPNAESTKKRQRGQNGRSERGALEAQLAEQQAERDAIQAHLDKIAEAEAQHKKTQDDIKAASSEEVAKKQQALQAKEDARAAKKAEQDQRLIENQLGKYDQQYEKALESEGRLIELEAFRYERKQLELQKELELLEKKGLLTEEIEARHRQAKEDAEIEHQNKLEKIREDKRLNDIKLKEIKDKEILASYETLTSGISSFYDMLGKKESGYVKSAISLGSILVDKKKQEALTNIKTSTHEAAMGAHKALSVIPIVGPGLGVAAAGLIYLAGGKAAADVAMAHNGMTNLPREGSYFLNGNERVVAPEQNRDLTQFLKNGGDSKIEINLIEDSEKAGSAERNSGDNAEQTINIFVANIREGGDAANVLESTYGIQRQGIS